MPTIVFVSPKAVSATSMEASDRLGRPLQFFSGLAEFARELIVERIRAGAAACSGAAGFGVAPSTAGNRYWRHQQTQSHAAFAMGGDRRSKLTEQAGWIAERLHQASELTLGEVRDELASRGIAVSYESVWRTVRRLGLLHKKRAIFAAEQDRLDVAIARDIWRAEQAGLDFARLVFVDETGTTTSVTWLRSWGPRGKPLLGKAPHGHWMTSTFVAGLAHDGIRAPMLIDTPITLSRHGTRQHRGVRQCLEDAGMGFLYLPAYSPGFNPIEQMFSKLKALLCQAAQRSFNAIWDALKTILRKVT